MLYPERFSNLPAHAWPRLRALLDVHEGGGPLIQMTIGEPKHAFPAWVTDEDQLNMLLGLTAIRPMMGHPN